MRILAATSRELVALEAHYHKSCYKNYTRQRPMPSKAAVDGEQEEQLAYRKAEGIALEQLFDYVR